MRTEKTTPEFKTEEKAEVAQEKKFHEEDDEDEYTDDEDGETEYETDSDEEDEEGGKV